MVALQCRVVWNCLWILYFFNTNVCIGLSNCLHDLSKSNLEVRNLNYKHEPRIQNTNGNTNVELMIDISWTFTPSEDRPIDGFLFHLQSLESSPPSSDFLPTNACVPPGNQWWISGRKATSCVDKPSCLKPSSTSCVCEKECFSTSNNCTHEIVKISDNVGSAKTVNAEIRSLKFHVKYFRKYVFLLVPYDRFGVGNMSNPNSILTIQPIGDCESLLQKSGFSRPRESISDTCCRNKGDNLLYRSRSVTVTQPRLDLTTGQYSMMITWLPPIADATDRYYDVLIERVDGTQDGMEQVEDWEEKKRSRTQSDSLLECDTSENIFVGKILYLLPGTEYYVDVYTIYEDEEVCEPYEECTATAYFTTPHIPPNPCVGHACVENAICTAAGSRSRPLVQCRCRPGFFGDGKNRTTWGHGTGCSFVGSNFTDTGYELRDQVLTSDNQPKLTSPATGLRLEAPLGSGSEQDKDGNTNKKTDATTVDALSSIENDNLTSQLSAPATDCTSQIDCVISENKYVILAVGGVVALGLIILLVVICCKYKAAGKKLNPSKSRLPSSSKCGRDDFEILDMRQVHHVTT
uniref:Uncharacterized protein LOC100183125 n=1 Tax=Phallusia mammillata TaxID=59560 RepID=A0A6F9DH31_9ASCI|nr:uncharacterized protein LOC100183125 [Phallusia mammillata]